MLITNYYEILELDPKSDADAIAKAVSEKRRFWQPKTSNPKLETRQLAEKMMKDISDAETIFGNAAKRADYDRQLAAQVEVPTPAPSAGPAAGRDWLKITLEYLSQGNAAQANYAAREATAQQSENPEAWYFRGVSAGLINDTADAEFGLSEAARLEPDNPVYSSTLGDHFRAHHMFDRAEEAYRKASNLAPERAEYRVALASLFVEQGRTAEALPILEEAARSDLADANAALEYASALIEDTTAQWSTRYILNRAQLDLTRQRLAAIQGLRIGDEEVLKRVHFLSDRLERAETMTWHRTSRVLLYLCGFLPLLLVAVTSFALLPAMYDGRVSGNPIEPVLVGSLCAAGAVLIAFVFVARHRMVGWKRDARMSSPDERRLGLQSSSYS